MKKLFLMLAIAGMVVFGACKADEETQKKQQEAQEKAKEEAGEMPEFDEQGNPIEKKKDSDASATTPADTSKKAAVKEEKKAEEPKKEEPKKDDKKTDAKK
ncbi:MAG: hypothetical protein RMJ97_01150 [Raineya sp.]|nr:hypothetical protein [Raineya sp.]